MDEITTAALVGTARMGQKPVTTVPNVDALMHHLGEAGRERALLLQAGAFAIYREAGQRPAMAATPIPTPAPPETQPHCSSQVASLVELLIKHQAALLPEACARLVKKGLCLPPELLPTVFSAKLDHNLRPALRQIIGERGRWLAQFNRAWTWATEAPLAGATLPLDADVIWQEGGASQRIEVLRRQRAADAAKARAWIMQVWKQERADMRVKMLQALEVGLAPEDEPLLEQALDDRVETVREVAASILPRLSTSAYAQCMAARAADMVRWADGTLTVKVKRDIELDPTWVRDGLPKAPGRKVSKTDWALRNVVQRIPLNYWTERYDASPTAFIEAALKSDHAKSFLISWTLATHLGSCADWIAPLWEWWLAPASLATQEAEALYQLIPFLTPVEAEQRARQWMPAPGENSNANWSGLLDYLTGPWSVSFGEDFLARLFAYLAQRLSTPELELEMDWTYHLDAAARCLPPACFATALLPIELPERDTWQARQWRRDWGEFAETITLRQRIIEEIA